MSTPLPVPSRLDQFARLLRTTTARANAKARQYAGHAVRPGNIARLLKPATKQIYARPEDPLSVSVSYVIMRNGIGVLGLALPIVLIVGGGLDHVQGSLSAYYHFSRANPREYGAGTMRDVFVGMLCAIGAFLFFYRGHSFQEDIALNVAGIAAVLVALVPMDWPPDTNSPATTAANIHSACATIFFIMIAYVCMFRARDTLCIMKSATRRRAFGRVYIACGLLMLATPASIAALEGVTLSPQNAYSTLLVEVAGVMVFAAFWLIKGFEIRSSLHLVFTSRSFDGPPGIAKAGRGACGRQDRQAPITAEEDARGDHHRHREELESACPDISAPRTA